MTFFIIFVLYVITLLLYEFPIVSGWGIQKVRNEIKKLKPIELSGKTLFVSDFQLRDSDIDKKFNINMERVEHIVIVGDFFHSPEHFAKFGSTDEERIMRGLATFLAQDFSGDIYWIWGKTHDPILPQRDFSVGGIKLHYLHEYGSFLIKGAPVVVLHGHQLYGGIFGGGISWLGQRLDYPLAIERLARKRFGIDENTWFITGHSHVPAIDHRTKTANTGSFAGVPLNFFFRIHVETGIVFEDDTVRLVEF